MPNCEKCTWRNALNAEACKVCKQDEQERERKEQSANNKTAFAGYTEETIRN